MSWKSWLVLGVIVAFTVFGFGRALLAGDDPDPDPTPATTATLNAPPSPMEPSSGGDPSSEPTTAGPTVEGEDLHGFTTEDASAAKGRAAGFVKALETYGPGVDMDQALRNAMPYMSHDMVATLDLDEPLSDPEYFEMVETGRTRIVEMGQIKVSGGDTGRRIIRLLVHLRAGWVKPGTTNLPASNPSYAMVLQMVDDDGTWGALDYRPADV